MHYAKNRELVFLILFVLLSLISFWALAKFLNFKLTPDEYNYVTNQTDYNVNDHLLNLKEFFSDESYSHEGYWIFRLNEEMFLFVEPDDVKEPKKISYIGFARKGLRCSEAQPDFLRETFSGYLENGYWLSAINLQKPMDQIIEIDRAYKFFIPEECGISIPSKNNYLPNVLTQEELKRLEKVFRTKLDKSNEYYFLVEDNKYIYISLDEENRIIAYGIAIFGSDCDSPKHELDSIHYSKVGGKTVFKLFYSTDTGLPPITKILVNRC